jgi:hypothetical protein
MQHIDLYCERLNGDFWAEPVNALTNAAFLIAALVTWRDARRSSALTTDIWALIIVTASIGVGSFLFHTFATGWSRVLDVVPILIFQLLFLWFYSRTIMGVRRGVSALLVGSFLVAALIGRQFPAILNGSLIYAPAFVTILGLGIYHARTQEAARYALLGSAAMLTLSLLCRTFDAQVCPTFPLGTHFLWHLANSAVLYLAMRTLVARRS